jgi:NAD(P)-dependent dehydrogenase (short-subunit alcohol dehydrogenase family)
MSSKKRNFSHACELAVWRSTGCVRAAWPAWPMPMHRARARPSMASSSLPPPPQSSKVLSSGSASVASAPLAPPGEAAWTGLGSRSSCADVLAALGGVHSGQLLRGCSVVLTGGTAGLGLETCLTLASAGATVIVGVRSAERGATLHRKVAQCSMTGAVHTLPLDLSSLASVRHFATAVAGRLASGGWPPLRQLILNAGVLSMDRADTVDGVELTFASNHLGHFLLTTLLLPTLRATGPGGRVVVVGSASHLGPLATGKKPLDREETWRVEVARPVRASWSLRREATEAYGSSKVHTLPLLLCVRVRVAPG